MKADSETDEEVDIEVMTAVQPKEDTTDVPSEPEPAPKEIPAPPPPTETSPQKEVVVPAHERNSSWSGFIKKKLSSFRTDASDKTSTTDSTPESKKRDWSKEQEALTKFKTSAVSTFSHVGSKFNEGSAYLVEASRRTAQATAENLKKIRLFKSPIEVVCRTEASQRPCPRLLLICCTAIASNGLSTEDIFKHDAPDELVHAVSAHFLHGNGATLPPSGASPEVLASVIKKFLMDLDEPLLTHKLCEEWINVGEFPQTAKHVVEQLPVANLTSLELLLDCLNRVGLNASVNQMPAESLAETMAPCLLWRVQKSSNSFNARKTPGSISKLFGKNEESSPEKEQQLEERGSAEFSSVIDSPAHSHQETPEKNGRVALQEEEMKKFRTALTFLIAHYKSS